MYIEAPKTKNMAPIKIILCEDDAEKREYLNTLMKGYGDFEVVGAFEQGEAAVEQAAALSPDVVIMDIELPGISGIESARQLKEAIPDTHIIMYTIFEDDDKLFDSLCAGASGYLLKKSPPHRLVESVKEVMEGGSPMSPGIARKVVQHFHQNPRKLEYPLNERELSILRLLAEGLPIKTIAGEVFLSTDGVKKNLKNIYLKLHVSCGKEAVAKAIRERIV
jgi:DNA-binding NarL/FixJ family response regulator